jgi:hypothetical protein
MPWSFGSLAWARLLAANVAAFETTLFDADSGPTVMEPCRAAVRACDALVQALEAEKPSPPSPPEPQA